MKKLLVKAFLILNFLTIVPLLLADLVHLLNPKEWWFPQFLSYFYLYLLIPPVLFLLLWFFYDFRISLANLFLLTLHWNTFASLYQVPLFKSSEKKKRDFRLVTYNACAFHYDPKEVKETIQKLKEINPDILCIQEFLTIKMPYSNIENLFKTELNLKYAYVDTLVKSNFAMAIFSRYPIKRFGRVTSRRHVATNGISFADLLLYGETLRVYNVHLHSYRFNKDSLQNAQWNAYWKILKVLVKTWRKQYLETLHFKFHRTTAPKYYLVVGDLNNPPASYFYYAVKGSLQDAFQVKGRGFSPTYRLLGKAWRIDFIFASDNLVVQHYFTDETLPSDHALVGADFDFDFHHP